MSLSEQIFYAVALLFTLSVYSQCQVYNHHSASVDQKNSTIEKQNGKLCMYCSSYIIEIQYCKVLFFVDSGHIYAFQIKKKD